MMQFFRGRLFKRFVMWLMALVFAVMFGMVVSGVSPDTLFTGGVQWVLEVNDEKIGVQDYQQALRQASDRAQDLLRAGQDVDIEQNAQDALIQRALLVSYAREHELVPKTKDLQRAIRKSPELADDFRPYGLAFTSAQAIEAFAQDQAIQGVRRLMDNLPVVTDAEIERDFIERNTKAKIRFLEFPYLKYESNVELTDEEVRSFYDSHQDLFWRGASVDVEFVKVEPSKARTALQVTDSEIEAYYEQHRSAYEQEEVRARHILRRIAADASPEELAKVRAKAQEILDMARKPDADFEALAVEYSEDPGSGSGGGDLGWFSRGDMVREFENAAFALSKEEPMSGLVKSQFGFHIIQFEDRRSQTRPLSEVSAEIQDSLFTTRSIEKAREDAEELFFEIDAEGVEAAIQSERFSPYELQVQTTGFFTQQDPSIPNVGSSYIYGDFITEAFETRPGDWGEPIEVQQTYNNQILGYYLLRVRERQAAGIAPFEQVQDDVEQLIKQQRAPQLALDDARALWAKRVDGEDLDALAAKHQGKGDDAVFEPRESGEFATQAIGYIASMGYCKSAMVSAFQMDIDDVRGVFEGQRAAYIIELTQRTDADLAELTDAEKANVRDRLLSAKRNAALQAWYQDIRDRADVKRNAERLATF